MTQGTRPVYSYDGSIGRTFRTTRSRGTSREPHLTLEFIPEHAGCGSRTFLRIRTGTWRGCCGDYRGSQYLATQVIGRTVDGHDMPLLTITNPAMRRRRRRSIVADVSAACMGGRIVLGGRRRDPVSAVGRRPRGEDPRPNGVQDFPDRRSGRRGSGPVRYNQNGYDLNRNWDTLDPVKMPEIFAQHKAVVDWVDGGHRVDSFLSLHNTETGEVPAGPGGVPRVGAAIVERLNRQRTFNPTIRCGKSAPGAAGRMTVAQGLSHDRKIPSMLMEQMIEYNSKLGAARRRRTGRSSAPPSSVPWPALCSASVAQALMPLPRRHSCRPQSEA